MEIDRYHRDTELADEPDDSGLPLAVLELKVPVVVAHGPCREESNGLAVLYLPYGLGDAFH